MKTLFKKEVNKLSGVTCPYWDSKCRPFSS